MPPTPPRSCVASPTAQQALYFLIESKEVGYLQNSKSWGFTKLIPETMNQVEINQALDLLGEAWSSGPQELIRSIEFESYLNAVEFFDLLVAGPIESIHRECEFWVHSVNGGRNRMKSKRLICRESYRNRRPPTVLRSIQLFDKSSSSRRRSSSQ